MNSIQVELGTRSYPIHIGTDLLSDRALFDRSIEANQVLIVSNETVAPLYLDRVEASLGDRVVKTLILPDGEQYKSLASFAQIIDALIDAAFHRDACVIALGGGVIGDLAGYAAASYQRGIDFVQIPTTILAQVDSSVGGKTAVNHPRAKNMIGAFYQPLAVITDLETLKTLPPRELAAGLAEIIKYGLIEDAGFLDWLDTNIEKLATLDSDALSFAVAKSCTIKAAVVAEDEREQGRRALLNLGHTFGHALEAIGGYGEWLHGEAVAIGTVMAARLSQSLGWLDSADCVRIESLFKRAQLPVRATGVEVDALMQRMQLDKKAGKDGIRLVLLRKLGEAVVVPAPEKSLIEAAVAGQLGS